ncbi:MAG: DUF885 domain-containing protein [Candidatus Sulfopaludibacter sp.]|nr:DUF885 domain-containing protein [Candidatus Sulfopaludibacter sp.]
MRVGTLSAGMFLTVLCFGQARDAELARLADRYFDEAVYRFDPVSGTAAGFHQYDSLLPDGSKAQVDAQIAILKKHLAEVGAFDGRGLSSTAAADRELVTSQIQGTLLELETIRPWERNPDTYSSGASNAIFVIMSRNFAPAAERLKAVIARERLIPRTFQSARANLRDPPRIYTEIALEQLPGIVSFFENDVPSAFKQVTGTALLAQFQTSNRGVIDALHSYQQFLKSQVLPVSKGDFRLGPETYARKLRYDEMVDTPLDRLLALGFENLRQNQAEFRRVAARIDPKRTPAEILQDLERDHPAPDQLLNTFRGVLGGLKEFIERHNIVTMPSPVPPIVEETPPFMRALTFASMDTPGPFEQVAKEAFFNVTLPEPNWPRQQVEEHMEGFNRGTVISTAVHEVYPGHYTQFLWLKQAPTKVRKLIGCSSNAEGWAHYSEQMMLDEGYGNGDPKLRLGQLQDALLRNARYIVGIEMHTGKMTYEQGIDFFVKEGYQTRANGERETKRGTSDPTYLYYTLGKLQILKLRQDYKQMKGTKYSLEEFHNNFMKQGYPPIRIVRRALLGNDSPVL